MATVTAVDEDQVLVEVDPPIHAPALTHDEPRITYVDHFDVDTCERARDGWAVVSPGTAGWPVVKTVEHCEAAFEIGGRFYETDLKPRAAELERNIADLVALHRHLTETTGATS